MPQSERVREIDLTSDLVPGAQMAAGQMAAGRWEPCADFTGTHADSPVCAGCGWLDQDHVRRAAVRPLRVPARRSARPRRLAS
jgi:hypothetical protein